VESLFFSLTGEKKFCILPLTCAAIPPLIVAHKKVEPGAPPHRAFLRTHSFVFDRKKNKKARHCNMPFFIFSDIV
jgi:hypothetical protein